MINLSLILPILNEEKNIKQSILTILQHRKNFSKFEIIAVNDGSKDKTLKILNELKRRYKDLKIVNHARNKGYGAALRSGIKHSSNEWIFFTDADMQFFIGDIMHFVPYTKDFDFIVGYRKNRADSAKRKFTSWVYNKFVKILFNLPLRDVDCAFKLMRKSAISQISFFSDSFFVSAELMTKAYQRKFKIKELGVQHLPREKGNSTVTIKKSLRALLDLVRLRFFASD